ncbi:hypothetical protein F5Y19DRAFT_373700 [Xylariaceae sp. FL1651]|nr:hypothetical protein F5Y19DRAFT_373700 [Xylariaceae sp. FL1651]
MAPTNFMAPTTLMATAKSIARATPPNRKTLTVEDVLGEIDEEFEDDSDWEVPSMKTLIVLSKVLQKGESLSDLLLKARKLKEGNHSVIGTVAQHKEPQKVRKALLIGTCRRRCRRSSRLRAVIRKDPTRAPKGLRKSRRIQRRREATAMI